MNEPDPLKWLALACVMAMAAVRRRCGRHDERSQVNRPWPLRPADQGQGRPRALGTRMSTVRAECAERAARHEGLSVGQVQQPDAWQTGAQAREQAERGCSRPPAALT